jgi:hypothetical protein
VIAVHPLHASNNSHLKLLIALSRDTSVVLKQQVKQKSSAIQAGHGGCCTVEAHSCVMHGAFFMALADNMLRNVLFYVLLCLAFYTL